MDEAVQPVDTDHQTRERPEEMLNGQFPENVQLLFDFKQLQSVPAGNVHSAFHKRHRCECAAELIDLSIQQISMNVHKMSLFFPTQYIRAQYHASTRNGNLCKTLERTLCRKTAVFGVSTIFRYPSPGIITSRSRHLSS